MRNINRHFRLEHLEPRCLLAALVDVEHTPTIASTQLADATSIDFSEVQGLRGAALEIRFDNERLRVEPRDIRAGSAWGGKGLSIANVDNDEGTISVFVFSAREAEVGHGSLVEIDFRRSHNSDDTLLPTIDINRLRLNDQEISFNEAAPDIEKNSVQDNSPKLSLQFNIAPEAEEVFTTNDPSLAGDPTIDAVDPDVLANDNNDKVFERNDSQWQGIDWQEIGAVLEHFADSEQGLSDSLLTEPVYDSEQMEVLDHEVLDHSDQPRGVVCWPMSFPYAEVDLAIMDWMRSPDELPSPDDLIGPMFHQADTKQTQPVAATKAHKRQIVADVLPVWADWLSGQATRSATDFSFVWTVRQSQPKSKHPDFASFPVFITQPKSLAGLLLIAQTHDDLEAID